MKERLLLEEKQRKQMESELSKLKKNLRESENVVEEKRYMKEDLSKGSAESGAQTGSQRSQGLKKSLSGQRATMARLCEEVGIQKILQLIKSEDLEVQIQAVKVVANLAAEEANQVKIVEEGGVEALLMLVQSSQNSTILRVASGAIANLAMNGEHFSWWSNCFYDIINPLNLLLRSRADSELKFPCGCVISLRGLNVRYVRCNRRFFMPWFSLLSSY
jgi:hypothetical protein